MGSLDDLQESFADLIHYVFDGLSRIGDSREQLVLYANATGTPVLPVATLARMKELSQREPNLQLLLDSVEVIEGVRDAIDEFIELKSPELTGKAKAKLAIEMLLRLVIPVLRWGAHAANAKMTSMILEVVTLLDNKIAANSQGFTIARILEVASAAGDTMYEGQQKRVLLPQLVPLIEFIVYKIIGYGKRHPQVLAAGWESPYLDHVYGVAQPWRDTATWMAQRTTSVLIVPQTTFKLDRYTNATPEPEPTLTYSATFVPVPAKRVWNGLPADAPVIADLDGPSMWTSIDVNGDLDFELGDNWSLHARGFGEIGFYVPFHDRHDGGAPLNPGAAVGAELELRWTADPPPTTPTPPPSATGGSQGGASLSLDKAAIIGFIAGGGVGTSGLPGDYGVGVRLSKLHLAITPSSNVLGALVNRSFSLTTDLGVVVSNNGLTFEGRNGLDLYVATRIELPFGLTLTYLRIAAIYDKVQVQTELNGREYDVETTLLGAQITGGLELSYLKIKLVLDGIGAKLVAQTTVPGGNLLGLANIEGDLVYPTGIGLRVDWSAVQGGGFFSYDKALDRYSGTVEFGFGKVSTGGKPKFVLRGVGFTEPRSNVPGEPHGGTTTLALVTGEFASWGLGGLVGVHRGMDLEAIRAALPTGGLDALLFPQDVVGHAAQIVATLAAMFPPAPAETDKHVLGLFGKYSWASGLASFAIGLIAEFSGSWLSWPSKVALPFSLKIGKEGRLKSLFWIEVDGLADYDAGTDEFELRGVLRNSRMLGADLVGGIVVFHGDPIPDDADKTRAWFFSLGGYHPSYYGGKGPTRARVDQRIGMVISRGNNVKLEVLRYLAKSPAGYHFGMYGHLVVQASGFGIEGKLWFDSVFHSIDSWTIGAGGSVALILFGETITELKLEGEFVRTDHVHFAGRLSFKLLWWTVHKHTEALMSDELGQDEQIFDVHQMLVQTVTAPESYPNTQPGDVALVKVERPGIWNAPEQPLAFLQKVLPLDTRIERIDSTTLSPPVTLARGPVTITGRSHDPVAALSEFSPAAFLELDTDAALHAPLGELWPAGFTVGDDVAAGDDHPAVALLDEITIDRAQRVKKPQRYKVSTAVLSAWSAPSLAVVATTPIRVKPVRFTSRIGDAPTTFASAWAARGTVLRRTKGVG
jgi:hypothetical protein